MLAFELRRRGWYLRQDIIWHKPNPMPESVKDRCTKSHEYIFLLSKSEKYYFDYEAIQEPAAYDGRKAVTFAETGQSKFDGEKIGDNYKRHGKNRWQYKNLQDKGQQAHTFHERMAEGLPDNVYPVRNKRDVWSVATKPFKEAHFAVFPPDLIAPCILAGSKQGGIVLDPFFGSGTTGVVATELGRDFIGIELNPKYVEIAKKRLEGVQTRLIK